MTSRRSKNRRDDEVELRFLEALHRRIGDDTDLLKALGDLYTALGRYSEGLEVDRKLVEMCPAEPLAWYNLGCSFALLKQAPDALKALRRAVKLGYNDREWMKKDSDLKFLHGDKRFEALLKEMAGT